MEIKNYVGQTVFDVADPDVLRLLEELKRKQATLQKDRPDIRYLFNRPPVPPGTTQPGGGKRRYENNAIVPSGHLVTNSDASVLIMYYGKTFFSLSLKIIV